MSEPEQFLSRWARLKREAAELATAQQPVVDLSALPAIESITATTDIRGFLAPGVPTELTRAALRRAWVVDPKIRDFIGIAENQWDFTADNAIPGFGPLGPLDDVRRLVAQAMGEREDEPEAAAASADENPQRAGGSGISAESRAEDQDVARATVPPVEAEPLPVVQRKAVDVAMQQELPLPAPTKRSHGGALPE